MLRQEHNLGFAKAINAGAAQASGDYLYLLNNDTIVVSDPFAPLLETLWTDASIGAVGPLLLYPGGDRVQHLGIAISHGIKSVHLYHLFPASHPVVARKRRLQAITMAAFCVERGLFLRLGGLFEGYVNGMEDIDFCLRMGREGLGCAVVPETVVHHLTSQSAGRFDHDGPNSRLLASRCGELLTPDLNMLAGEDGYCLRFTSWLDPYLGLGRERAAEIESVWLAEPDRDRLAGLLLQEPCWERGWDRLIRHCRENGDTAGVLSLLVQKSAFFPTPETFAAMKQAAVLAGDASRLAALADQDDRIGAVMARPLSLRAQARGAMSRAGAVGNDGLAAILTDWLAENFSPDGNT